MIKMKCEYCGETDVIYKCNSCEYVFCEDCKVSHEEEEIDNYIEHNRNIIVDEINKQIHKIRRDNNAN
jgi:hypothetical protein